MGLWQVVALASVCVTAAAGCESGGGPGAAEETTASVEQALGTNDYPVTLSLPAFAKAGDTVLAADGVVDVGDRVVVVKGTGSPGVLTNTGTGGTTVGASAHVSSVSSLSQITVRSAGIIDGDVMTTVPLVLQNQAKVTGTINQNAVFLPKKTVAWTVHFPSTSRGDVTVNQGSASLTPDRYGNVIVNSGGALTLSAGTYYMDSFTLNSGATLKLDQSKGPVMIDVRSAMAFRGVESVLGGGTAQLLVVYLGTADTVLEAPFVGTFLAPNGRLVLGASGAQHQGTFMAKNLEVYAGVTVKPLRLTGDFDGDGLSTADEIDIYGTNPFVADTDGDGLNDGTELAYWNSRTDGIHWYSDVDVIGSAERSATGTGDGLINLLDSDSDNDGLLDGAEVLGWSMPVPGGSSVHVDADPAKHDTDGDGLLDSAEHDGTVLTIKGATRLVYSHPRIVDTDGDGLDDLMEVKRVFSDPQVTHTFTPFYADADRATNIATAGPSVLDPPCTLYTNGQPENVFVTFYTLQPQITTPTLDSRSVRQLYVPNGDNGSVSKAGVPFTVHFRSELAGDPTQTDPNDTFSNVQLQRPDNSTYVLLSAGPNPGEYSVDITPTSSTTYGFYQFQLLYHFDNNLSKYHFYATFDDDGTAVPLAWTDPDIASHVDLGFFTDGTAPSYLRGGAYGDGSDGAKSFISNITLDGQLLYQRAFNGADFNYPLGSAALGTHNLSFDWTASSTNTAKLMTHICQFGVPWNDVQITYMSDMHVRDYGAWKTGVATQEAVVRRDATFLVIGHGAGLAGGDGSIQIFKSGSAQSGWTTVRKEDYDARDGHFQHWEVTVPANVAIGEYTLRMLDKSSTPVSGDVPFRVIFNPYRLVDSVFTHAHLETYAYDEDEDGDNFGVDSDHGRDEWTAFSLSGVDTRTYDVHSFKARDGQVSVLDLALAATDGTTDEFQAATLLFRVMNQRIFWFEPYSGSDVDDLLGTDNATATALTTDDTRTFSADNQDLFAAFPTKRINGQCMDFAAGLVGLARAIGIPSKHVATPHAFGWTGFHAWSEVYLPTSLLPQQQGSTTSGGGTNSDVDNWYVFDSTDNFSSGGWEHSEESIDPRVDFYASFVDNGASVPTNIYTTKVDWCPPGLGTCTQQADDILTTYNTPTDFWITSSSVTAWLSGGDKDIFRLHVTSPVTVSVSASSDLDIVTCAYNVAPSSVPFTQCGDAAASRVVQPGDWWIQVFSLSPHDGVHGGNHVPYTLNVQ
jgi:transglutaminase-like putative cysteine protease